MNLLAVIVPSVLYATTELGTGKTLQLRCFEALSLLSHMSLSVYVCNLVYVLFITDRYRCLFYLYLFIICITHSYTQTPKGQKDKKGISHKTLMNTGL